MCGGWSRWQRWPGRPCTRRNCWRQRSSGRASGYAVHAVAEFGMHAGVYFPLAHEDHLIGVLAIGTMDPQVSFPREVVQMLELLAGTAAAVLAGLRHARELADSLAAQQRAQ